jgi:phosphatidylglycerophosphatase A
MKLDKIIATGFGIGSIRKGGGTLAAAVCGLVWYLSFSGGYDPVVVLLVTVALTDVGLWSAQKAEKYWGIDSHHVVIDEIAGMCLSLLFIPVTIATVVTAFVLFRIFDIWKPLYIRRLEALPGGVGVMADDLLAGLYTNIILQVLVWTSVF